MLSNTKEKIIAFIKKNKWIILVSLFFIGWKFFLIHVFFSQNEFSKDGETITYITHIDSINQCSYLVFCKGFLTSFANYFGFEHLSYRLFFGAIGHLLKIDSIEVFHLSFYIGILILLPALIFFLKNIETDKKLIAFLLFFLALYNGGGSHGFWWVVPDFFALLVGLIVFTIILGKYKNWKMWIIILIPIGFYMHTIFAYLLTTIVFFHIFYYLLTKKIDTLALKKTVFSFCVLAIFYIPTSFYLNGNPYGAETFIAKSNIGISGIQIFKKPSTIPTTPQPCTQTENNRGLKYLFPGFSKLKDRYFNWIFFNPQTPVFGWKFNPFSFVFVAIFFYILFILFYYRQYKVLSLYLSALVFTLISSINPHADRALPIIWPITFLLYAYGIWYSFRLINGLFKNIFAKKIIKIFIYLSIVIFIIINLIYSYGINQSIYFNPQEFLNNYVRNNW